MKKVVSIALLMVVVLTTVSTGIYAEKSEYAGVEIMNDYLEEDINNYFLPVAYDLTHIYDGVNFQTEYSYYECIDEVYTKLVQYDDSRKINIPPIKTVFDTEKFNPYSDTSLAGWFLLYVLDVSEEYRNEFNSQMRRAVCPGFSSQESAKRILVAPWTLYDSGELYTWSELMSMSEEELDKQINYQTPDFEKFIINVKTELEKRGWWKEEYQEKYEILYSHKDDYQNSLDESEDFILDGNVYNFATMYYEYTISGEENLDDIIMINFHREEFDNVLNNISNEVFSKYKNMFDDIKEQLENDKMRKYTFWGSRIACKYMMKDFSFSAEQQEFIDNEVFGHSYIINEGEFDLNKVRKGVEDYCYELHEPIPKYRIDMFVSGNLRDSVRAFASDNLLIYNVEKMDFEYMSVLTGSTSHFIGKEDRITDIDKLIDDIKRYSESSESGYFCQDDIEYLESLLEGTPPQTGENTILYLGVALASVVCMASMVARCKKEVV